MANESIERILARLGRQNSGGHRVISGEDIQIIVPTVPEAGFIAPSNEAVAKPDAPAGFTSSERGLIKPQSLGLILPETKEILKPTAEDLKLIENKAEERDKQKQQERIWYLATPWDFFKKKLSNIDGIEALISEIKDKFEKQKLDPATLDCNHWDEYRETTEINPEFYNFLLESVTLACETMSVGEADELFMRLNILIESQIYSNRSYKIKNDEVLEKITETLEKNGVKFLTPTACDFFSYFEISDGVKPTLYEFVKDLDHPLKHYLQAYLEGKEGNEDKKSYENIGVEVECLPVIAVGRFPRGFEMGADGDGYTPELRRKFEAIRYDHHFKEDLYDFWYWAKMSRVQGISMHIHLDDDVEGLLPLMKRVFGHSENNVKWNDPAENGVGTVEIRFDLPCFSYLANVRDRKTQIKEMPPLDPEVYNIFNLIDQLLLIKNNQDLVEFNSDQSISLQGKILGDKLHPHWKKRFFDRENPKRLLRAIGATKTIEDLNEVWRPEYLHISPQVAGALIEKYQSHDIDQNKLYKTVNSIFERMSGPITEMRTAMAFIKIYHQCDRSGRISYVIKRMSPEITTDNFFIKIISLLKEDMSYGLMFIYDMPTTAITKKFVSFILGLKGLSTDMLYALSERIPEGELDQATADKILKLSEDSEYIFSKLLKNKRSQDFTQQYIYQIFEEKQLDHSAFETKTYDDQLVLAICHKVPIEHLNREVFELLIKNESTREQAFSILIKKIPPEEFNKQLIDDLIGFANNNLAMTTEVVRAIPAERLTQEIAEDIQENFRELTTEIWKKNDELSGGPSLETIQERIEQAISVDKFINHNVFKYLAEKTFRLKTSPDQTQSLTDTIRLLFKHDQSNQKASFYSLLNKLKSEELTEDLFIALMDSNPNFMTDIHITTFLRRISEFDKPIPGLFKKIVSNDDYFSKFFSRIPIPAMPIEMIDEDLIDKLIGQLDKNRVIFEKIVNLILVEKISLKMVKKITYFMTESRYVPINLMKKMPVEFFDEELVEVIFNFYHNNPGQNQFKAIDVIDRIPATVMSEEFTEYLAKNINSGDYLLISHINSPICKKAAIDFINAPQGNRTSPADLAMVKGEQWGTISYKAGWYVL